MPYYVLSVVSRKLGSVNSRMEAREFLVEAADRKHTTLMTAWNKEYASAWECLYISGIRLDEETKVV